MYGGWDELSLMSVLISGSNRAHQRNIWDRFCEIGWKLRHVCLKKKSCQHQNIWKVTRLHYHDRIVFCWDNYGIILVPANLELICSVVQRRERGRRKRERWRVTKWILSSVRLFFYVSFLTNLNVIVSAAVRPLRAAKVQSVPWNCAAQQRPGWKVTSSVSAADCDVSPVTASSTSTLHIFSHFTSVETLTRSPTASFIYTFASELPCRWHRPPVKPRSIHFHYSLNPFAVSFKRRRLCSHTTSESLKRCARRAAEARTPSEQREQNTLLSPTTEVNLADCFTSQTEREPASDCVSLTV